MDVELEKKNELEDEAMDVEKGNEAVSALAPYFAIGQEDTVPQGACARNVLQEVNLLRKLDSSYCDLIIEVDGKSFSAHRIIMAGFSPFFKKRILTGPVENNTVEITGMSADIFQIILEYAYAGSITINAENAEDLLRSSCRLEALSLANICEEFLGRRTNLNNFFRFYGIAGEYYCSVLANYVNEFMLRYFSDICELDSFVDMKPEMLIEAIKSDELVAFNEEAVLKAVLKWTNYNKEREQYLTKLLTYVRLPRVDTDFLNKCMREESAVRTSADCMFSFSEALMIKFHPSSLAYISPSCFAPRQPVFSDSEFIILAGGKDFDSEGFAGPLYSLSMKTRQILPIKPLPVNGRVKAVTMASDVLYVVVETDPSDTDSDISCTDVTLDDDITMRDLMYAVCEINPNGTNPYCPGTYPACVNPQCASRKAIKLNDTEPGNTGTGGTNPDSTNPDGTNPDSTNHDGITTPRFLNFNDTDPDSFEFDDTDCDDGDSVESDSLGCMYYMRYNLRTNDWEEIGHYRTSDHCEGIVELDGSLYEQLDTDNLIHRFSVDNIFAEEDLPDIPNLLSRFIYDEIIKNGKENLPDVRKTEEKPVVFRVEDKIYFIGRDQDPNVNLPIFRRFDPSTKEWTELASLLEAHEEYLRCSYEGKIFVFDGEDNEDDLLMRPQVYDIATDTWEWGASLNKVAESPAALEVLNGRLTFMDKTNFPFLQVEQYSSQTKSWESYSEVKVSGALEGDELHFFAGTLKMQSP